MSAYLSRWRGEITCAVSQSMTRMKLRTAGKSGIHRCARAILFSIAIVMLCAAGCKPGSNVSPNPPLVEVATVTQGDPPIYQEWIGTLDGLVNAQIRAQVTGYLLAQDYREGDTVKKGQVIARLDRDQLG